MASAKKTNGRSLTKKDFILQQAKDLPAKDVVQKAAAQGIELNEKHVHVVRSASKTKAKSKTGKAAKRGAKKPKAQSSRSKKVAGRSGKKKHTLGVSKSEFIRKLPANLSAKEVVTKAAAQGIDMSEKYVYVIRSAANARKNRASGLATQGKRKSEKQKTNRRGSSGNLEAQLRQAIADCGLVRSREIFSEVEAAFSGG